MAKKADTEMMFVATNKVGRPRVRYIAVGNDSFIMMARVTSDPDGIYILSGTIKSAMRAFQLRNRIAGKGVINTKLWVRMEAINNPFEVQD